MPHFCLRKDAPRAYTFELLDQAGVRILQGDTYAAKDAAAAWLRVAQECARRSECYDVFTTTPDRSRFVLKAGDGRVLAVSETFATPSARDAALETCKSLAGRARVEDQTGE